MDFTYDDQNLFAKILRKEIPNTTIYEDDHALAFHDIAPQAPIHALVVPKGPYVSLDHMCLHGTPEELAGFMRAVGRTVEALDLDAGFRTIANARGDGMQEVPHLHFHILGGRRMGPLVAS